MLLAVRTKQISNRYNQDHLRIPTKRKIGNRETERDTQHEEEMQMKVKGEGESERERKKNQTVIICNLSTSFPH